jgi:N-methylhydantoinase A
MRPVLMAVRSTVVSRRSGTAGALPEAPEAADGGVPARRAVHFAGAWLETPVHRREALSAGVVLEGPAIVEQLDTTVLIGPRDRAEVDRWGNLIIAVDAAARPQEGTR